MCVCECVCVYVCVCVCVFVCVCVCVSVSVCADLMHVHMYYSCIINHGSYSCVLPVPVVCI